MDKITSGVIYSILGLVFALFIFSALFFLPLTRELGIWHPATRYLSFALLALCIAILAIYLIQTRHPHYDIWLMGGGGIILSVFGISGGPKGIVMAAAYAAFAALLFAVPVFFLCRLEKAQEFISQRGWALPGWISKGLDWIWAIAASVITLSLIGLCFYCLFIFLSTLIDKEYFISILFLILGMVTGGTGIWLMKYSIHEFKSIANQNHSSS